MAAPDLAQAHIIGQARVRAALTGALATIWKGLPAYDRVNVDEWLSRAVPLSLAAQRHSVALTDAYLARELGRLPLGINADHLVGAAVRSGAAPETVYERPFVTVWTALKAGTEWEQAVDEGLQRATAVAATDVQLSMRATAAAVGEADPHVYGYQRVPDASACELCLIASTQRYHSSDLLPIHAHCGCGIAPLTDPADHVINRDLYTELKSSGAMDHITAQRQVGGYEQRAAENRQIANQSRADAGTEQDPARRARLEARAARYDERADAQQQQAAAIRDQRDTGDGTTVAVRHHGELGPVLVNAAHHFTVL